MKDVVLPPGTSPDLSGGVREPAKVGPGRYSYGPWHIEHDPPPIPVRSCDWQFWHDDYDGAPDGNDRRCGFAGSLAAVVAEIHELEDDQ